MSEDNGKLAVTVVERKPLERIRYGSATVRIGAMRLTTKDLTVHEQNDKRWVGLPAKAQIGRDQELVRRDGKVQYASILEFDTKDVADAFGAAVLRALDEHLSRGRVAA